MEHSAELSTKLSGKIPHLPQFDAELEEIDLKLGKSIEPEGDKVDYVKTMRIPSTILTLIDKIELKLAA